MRITGRGWPGHQRKLAGGSKHEKRSPTPESYFKALKAFGLLIAQRPPIHLYLGSDLRVLLCLSGLSRLDSRPELARSAPARRLESREAACSNAPIDF